MKTFLRSRDRLHFFQKNDFTIIMRVSCIYLIATLGTASMLAAEPSNGQGLEQEVTIGMDHESARALFEKIEAVTGYTFVFMRESVDPHTDITFASERRTIRETLSLALAKTAIEFQLRGHSIVLLDRKTSSADGQSQSNASKEMQTVFIAISGTVKDKMGEPLPGVNVVVKGTTIGTSTDAAGRFVIDVASDASTLVFSFIGLRTIELPLNGQTIFNIQMDADVTTLGEVVISGGYYLTTDRMKTGSIVKVQAKEIGDQPVTSPLMALQGRVPGLDITPTSGVPGSAISVQIRGRNSLRNNTRNEVANSPLYVINGVPIDPTPIRSNSQSSLILYNGYDPLASIDPSNIESIEVLKDADATSIYGSRGANGVILITTKRGTNNGKTNVDVNLYTGIGKVSNEMKLLNTQQYLTMRREAFKNDGEVPGPSEYDVNGTWDTTRYTNWQKELLGGSARINDIQLGFSGGNQTTSFRLGAGYHKESTVYSDDFGYERFSGNLNINHRSVNQKFGLGVSMNYGLVRSKSFEGTLISQALELPPNAPQLYNDDGTLNWAIMSDGPYQYSTFDNPLAQLLNTNEMDESNFVANLNLDYKLGAGFDVKGNFGFTDLNANELIKHPLAAMPPIYLGPSSTTSADFGSNRRRSWIIEPQVNYAKVTDDHSVNVTLGATWQESSAQSQLMTAAGYSSDLFLTSLDAAKFITVSADVDNRFKYGAVFLRGSYAFAEKYLLSLTGRRDGSSRFGPGHRIGSFGSIGAGWLFSNEGFMRNLSRQISHGKLRASYGLTGNDQIGDYKFIDSYNISEYTYQGGVALTAGALFNTDLSWEVTKKFEAAIELGLFEDRVYFEVGIYKNTSSNQLVSYLLPSITGFGDVFRNFPATVENRGIEGLIRFRCIDTKDWKWNVSANISRNQNELKEFPDLDQSPYAKLYLIGEPLSVLPLYVYKGVNAQTGLRDFEDPDGDGSYTDLDQKLKNPVDRSYYGGLTNAVRFRSFELSFLLQFSKQSKLGYLTSYQPGARNFNMPVEVMDRWQRDGDVARYPKFTQGIDGILNHIYYTASDGAVADASFVRLKSATLSYDLPSRASEKIRVSQIRLFAQGQNLFTLSDFPGLDPETGMALPPLRMISIGLQVRL